MMRVRFNLNSPRGHHLSWLHQQFLDHTHHTRLELQLSLHGVTVIPQLLGVSTEDGSFPNPFSLGHVPGEKFTGNGGMQRDQVGWRIRVHCCPFKTKNHIIILGDFPQHNQVMAIIYIGSANLLRSRACLAILTSYKKPFALL